jgi:hypothetical protein
MWQPHVNDCVRLIHGVPNDFLPVGAVGVIQSIWREPDPGYEVEFRLPATGEIVREVLEADQIEWVESAMPPPDATSWERYENEGGQTSGPAGPTQE